ncbi:MAG TPA: hypothetical protein VJL07_06280 [Dehalococcoidia bacterium]|nr:hypothetical protein [Dehalococcoidia bacterium]
MNQPAPQNSNRSRYAAACCWSIGLGAIAIALVSLATSSMSRGAGAQAGGCPAEFTIDFAGLPNGTHIGEQYAGFGVHISGIANGPFPDQLIVFDTNSSQTHDPDLAIGIGNIAIFAKNLTDVDPADGLVDDPDENDVGGTATFAFDQEVSIGSVQWVDKDHSNPNFVVAYNAAGGVIVSVPVPVGANGSVQTIAINADGVRRLVFDYQESGGFTGIEVACPQPTPSPTSTSTVQTPGPTATPTAAATATPTAPPTPTQPPTPSPTPTASPATASPSPTVASADTSIQQTPTALGASDLPAGGGAPSGGEAVFSWATALLGAALVAGGSFVWVRNGRR